MEVQGTVPESHPPKFTLAVDTEHKATEFRLFSVAAPHMRAFHLAWVSFFSCFVSTFAAPPLLPIIRDNLNLTSTDIGNAGIAAVSGAVFARLAMGTACDLFGPRLASASLILLTTPAVYFTSIASSPVSFLLVRFFTGFSIATFVSTQFWMSSMFSAPVVGTANGVAGGWGNLGGGATQLIMPIVFGLIRHTGADNFTAWRIAFFIPALFQTLSAFAVLIFGQDLPDGNFRGLQKSGDKPKDKFSLVFYHGITNYRGWILALTYGYCFGVELAVDNIIAEYFYDRFNLKLHTAGMIAASFGLANVISRPGGGIISDVVAKRFGMRGRLWTLWVVQTLGGVFCIILGQVGSLSASIAVMIAFSLFVQAACGLTFGVVPFISRRGIEILQPITNQFCLNKIRTVNIARSFALAGVVQRFRPNRTKQSCLATEDAVSLKLKLLLFFSFNLIFVH
ncbi:Nitrate transporter2.5 isoform 3, partial [Theobroma cacao]